MLPRSGLRGVEGLGFEITASSIGRFIPIKSWIMGEGSSIELPFRVDATPNESFRFQASVSVPESKHRWFLKLLLSGNALVRIDNDAWGYDEAHTYFPLSPGNHTIMIEATPRTLFGQHMWEFRFNYAYLIEVNWDVLRLGLRLLALVDFASGLPSDSGLRRDLEELLINVTKGVRVNPTLSQITLMTLMLYDSPLSQWFSRGDLRRPPDSFIMNTGLYGLGVIKGHLGDVPKVIDDDSIASLVKGIEDKLNRGLSELTMKYPKEGVLLAVGHAHIDAAWLWPKAETINKVLRTFSTIVGLMREYDFSYIQSSAQYYEWVEHNDKGLFSEVSRLIKLGRWIIAGGMWIESDANIIDGESLVRQFLYGQRYFLSRFGKLAKIGWLPDTFGFSANLPQILRKSGIDVFVSWRIVTHELTQFPYHVFTWEGIDGSEIPTQVILVNYNNTHTPLNAYRAWSMYEGKGTLPQLIYPYGYGDGGGGPTREMLEYRDLMNRLPNIPSLVNLNEDDYASTLVNAKDKLPRWRGEIHVENFRGTYTTNLLIKELIAKAEAKLTDAELWVTLAYLTGAGDHGLSELEGLWKTLLFNQFHDIVPGSAIKEVYDDAYGELRSLLAKSEELINESTTAISKRFGIVNSLVVFNSAPWGRGGIIKVPRNVAVNSECQDFGDERLIYVEAPPVGFRAYAINGECVEPKDGVMVREDGGGFIMENSYVKVKVNSKGDIESIILKGSNAELINGSVKLMAHIEEPIVSDAWRFSLDSLNDGVEFNLASPPRVSIKGPLMSCIDVDKGFSKSRISQRICLSKYSPLIEVWSRIKWIDEGVLVKYWVNTTVESKEAVYDIPFGTLTRPTDPQVQVKEGKIEVPALRWVDLSDGAKGLAVISPSRHGYSVIGGRIGLSLLRSPTFPNPWSDLGDFETSIFIYPHMGDYKTAEVPKVTYDVMHELRHIIVSGVDELSNALGEWSFMELKPHKAVLTAVKTAEDSRNELIIRFYNPYDSSISMDITINDSYRPSTVVETNLIETEDHGSVNLGSIVLEPYEVKTLRMRLS